MKRVATPTLFLAALLFVVSAAANEQCPELARNASKAAQDYRQAVGEVRRACDSTFEECIFSRSKADQALALLAVANQAMLEACEFTSPTTDDSLPITAATVAAAIDTLPSSVLIPCSSFDLVDILTYAVKVGCPDGWLLNIPRTAANVFPYDTTLFTYDLSVNASGAIPVKISLGSSEIASCTLTVSTSTGVPVIGSATFSRSIPEGTTNRLQLAVTSVNTASIDFGGCGAISFALNSVKELVLGSSVNAATVALSANFCGADGPELFGPCP